MAPDGQANPLRSRDNVGAFRTLPALQFFKYQWFRRFEHPSKTIYSKKNTMKTMTTNHLTETPSSNQQQAVAWSGYCIISPRALRGTTKSALLDCGPSPIRLVNSGRNSLKKRLEGSLQKNLWYIRDSRKKTEFGIENNLKIFLKVFNWQFL